MENAEKWRKKYLAGLEREGQKDRDLSLLEQLLRHAISRLTLAADGVDGLLDRQMEKLRRQIRKDIDPRRCMLLLDDISGTLERIEHDKAAGHLTRLSASQVIVRLIDGITAPPELVGTLSKLRKRLLKAVEHEELNKLIVQLAELLGAHLSPHTTDSGVTTAPAIPPDNIPAIRDTLLHLLREIVTTTSDEKLIALHDKVTAADFQSELEGLARELAVWIRSHTTSNSPLMSVDPAPAWKDTQSPEAQQDQVLSPNILLIELLEHLTLPPEVSDNVDDIKSRLAQDIPATQWKPVLSSIANVITSVRIKIEAEKIELEGFLRQLTSRLRDIDHHLQGTEHSRRVSYSEGRKLDAAVRENVRDIASRVDQAGNLVQIKQTIQVHLDQINSHLEVYQKNEGERQSRLEEQLDQLKQRLNDTQRESESLRERLQKERNQSKQDVLTGVPNRLAYEERLAQEVARWRRYQSPLNLAIFDIDLFKQLNDSYGHKAGDKALRLVAQVLKQNLRETDFIARLGGEEFICLFPGVDLPGAVSVAEKLRKAIEETQFHNHGKRVPISISCGIAPFNPADEPDAVFQAADAALYRSKHKGRNRCTSSEDIA